MRTFGNDRELNQNVKKKCLQVLDLKFELDSNLDIFVPFIRAFIHPHDLKNIFIGGRTRFSIIESCFSLRETSRSFGAKIPTYKPAADVSRWCLRSL